MARCVERHASHRSDRYANRWLQSGLFGDHAPVGGGVSELRIHHGPGYRLYYTLRGKVLVILLVGGTKGSQKKDIAKAKELVAGL